MKFPLTARGDPDIANADGSLIYAEDYEEVVRRANAFDDLLTATKRMLHQYQQLCDDQQVAGNLSLLEEVDAIIMKYGDQA